MIIGIVGSEEAKFTELGKTRAFEHLVKIIDNPSVIKVVSGGCHLGGIDKWAIQVAGELGKETQEFLPEILQWEGGYKQRNIEIATESNETHCITIDRLPDDFNGMKFAYCYHCANTILEPPPHVKSGGCWTMKYARRLGKHGILHVINNF